MHASKDEEITLCIDVTRNIFFHVYHENKKKIR